MDIVEQIIVGSILGLAFTALIIVVMMIRDLD